MKGRLVELDRTVKADAVLRIDQRNGEVRIGTVPGGASVRERQELNRGRAGSRTPKKECAREQSFRQDPFPSGGMPEFSLCQVSIVPVPRPPLPERRSFSMKSATGEGTSMSPGKFYTSKVILRNYGIRL